MKGSSNQSCAKLFLFLFVAIALIGMVSAVECNADLSVGSCTISNNLTLSGNYYRQINISSALIINNDSITFDCNNSIIYGTRTQISNTSFDIGILVGNNGYGNNLIIKNCDIRWYYHPLKAYNNIENITIINSSFRYGVYNLYFDNVRGITLQDIDVRSSNRNNIFIHNTNRTIINNVLLNYSSSNFDLIQVYGGGSSYKLENITSYGDTTGVSIMYYNVSDINMKNIYCYSKAYRCIQTDRPTTNLFASDVIINTSLGTNRGISLYEIKDAVIQRIKIIGQNNSVYINYNSTNITVKDSTFINNTGKTSVQLVCEDTLKNSVWNINFINNTISGSDFGIYVGACANVTMENNTIFDMTRLYDGFGVNIYIERARNTIIRNNNLSYNLAGILVHNSSGVQILNNYFDEMTTAQKRALALGNGYEIPSAIDVVEIFKTWIQDATETQTDALAKIRGYSSSNVNITGNTFGSNSQVYLYSQGAVNLKHDLTGFWFRSFQAPTYLVDRTDLYISNRFSNITQCQNGKCGNVLAQGYAGSAIPNKFNYTWFKDSYDYYKNLNQTTNYVLALFNLSSDLVYTSNGTLPCGYLVTGDCNITLQPNNYTYVLDNFQIAEDGRLYSPVYITNPSSSEKHLVNTLSSTFNSSVTLSVDCTKVGKITYTSNSGNFTKSWNYNEYTCSNNQVTLTEIVIEPALNSNVFTISNNKAIQDSCNGITTSFTSTIVIIGLILAIIFIAGIIGVLLSSFGIIPEIEITDNVTLNGIIIGVMMIAGLGILVITIVYLFESGLCPVAGA